MRKYIITALFALLLASSAALLFMPADTESIAQENREIAQMPEFSKETALSGEFAKGFDSYVNDNIGLRGKLMELSSDIKSRFGFTPKLVGKIISATSDIGIGQTYDSSLMLLDGKIMEMFQKNSEVEVLYAQTLNKIAEKLPDSVKMYSMLIPTQLEYAAPLYRNAQDSQKSSIENVYGNLDKSITTADAYTVLGEHSDEYIYFRTDHHWTMEGAYYGYCALSDATGTPHTSIGDYEKEDAFNFHGTLYQKAKSQIKNIPEDTMYYYDTISDGNFSVKMRTVLDGKEYVYGEKTKIFDKTKSNYQFFMGGDNPLTEITNKNKPDGKTIILIKDSYVNAMIPWIIGDYKQVILIDPRSYTGNLLDEIQRYNASEVAVVNYVFTTTFSDYCTLLEKLIPAP